MLHHSPCTRAATSARAPLHPLPAPDPAPEPHPLPGHAGICLPQLQGHHVATAHNEGLCLFVCICVNVCLCACVCMRMRAELGMHLCAWRIGVALRAPAGGHGAARRPRGADAREALDGAVFGGQAGRGGAAGPVVPPGVRLALLSPAGPVVTSWPCCHQLALLSPAGPVVPPGVRLRAGTPGAGASHRACIRWPPPLC